jgi:hypothetical protein
MLFKLVVKLSIVLVLGIASTIASADNVEMTLTDKLDGDLNGYCLDMRGYKTKADPSKGLQTHTCYSYTGSLAVDQIIDTTRFPDGVLYMPSFDVCITLTGIEAGARVGLAACDGSDLQLITLTESGKLSPALAMDMCFTAGQSTRFGRGGKSRHQIKSLLLQVCNDNLNAFQTWRMRTEID